MLKRYLIFPFPSIQRFRIIPRVPVFMKLKKTLAYAPHCNPVEQTNKTIKTMIAQFMGKNHRHWDRHIPALQFAYNTAQHDRATTGYTPAFLNHGRELQGSHSEDRRRNYGAIASEINQHRLEEVHGVIQANLAPSKGRCGGLQDRTKI